jgi:hypothetical protein
MNVELTHEIKFVRFHGLTLGLSVQAISLTELPSARSLEPLFARRERGEGRQPLRGLHVSEVVYQLRKQRGLK